MPRHGRPRRRSGVPDAPAAPARLHERQVQDPHHRNRQPPDRRRSDPIRFRRARLHGDAGLARHPARRRDPRRRRLHQVAVAPVRGRGGAGSHARSRDAPHARERRARLARVPDAAVRQVPRRGRPRHGRRHHRLPGRLGPAAARRRSHRTVDVPGRRRAARHLPAFPHRHVGHADAVVQGSRERRRHVGPRELHRVARPQAGVGDGRRGGVGPLRAERGGGEGRSREARRVPRDDAAAAPSAIRRSATTAASSRR